MKMEKEYRQGRGVLNRRCDTPELALAAAMDVLEGLA